MSLDLTSEDARALDLLLDRTSSSSVSGNATAVAGPRIDPARVVGAQRVLKLLNNLPAEEPASDLVAQTLRRVGETEQQPGMMPPGFIGIGRAQTQQQTHA